MADSGREHLGLVGLLFIPVAQECQDFTPEFSVSGFFEFVCEVGDFRADFLDARFVEFVFVCDGLANIVSLFVGQFGPNEFEIREESQGLPEVLKELCHFL